MKRYCYLVLIALGAPALAAQGAIDPPPRRDATESRHRETDDMALVLGLGAAKRPALDDFLAASAPPPPPAPSSRLPEGKSTAPPSFEQQLVRREQRATEMNVAELKRIADARSFYGALNARQRQKLEAMLRLRRSPDGPGFGHGPDSPGGPGDGPGGHRR